MKKKTYPLHSFVFVFILMFFMAEGVVAPQNPLPVLDSISPGTKVQRLPTFTLTAAGSDFIPASVIVFNGVVKPTTYVDATRLTCPIDPNDILVPAGQPDLIVPVSVRNPAPGGGDSDTVDFTIRANHSFTAVTTLSETGYYASNPQVEVDNQGIIHVAWDVVVNFASNVKYRRSTDNGATWDTVCHISPTNWTQCYLTAISIVEQPDDWVYIFFKRNEAAVNRIYYRCSSDNGATWGPITLVLEPTIALPHLVFTDPAGNFLALGSVMWLGAYDVFFGFSQDKGITWPTITNVSQNAGTSRWSVLDLAANGDIHVAWLDDTPGQALIHYSRSVDNGANFNPPIPIVNSVRNWDIEVDAAPPGEVYITWTKASLQAPFITSFYMSYSNDNGLNFTPGVGRPAYSIGFRDKEVCVDSAGNIDHVASDSDCSMYYAWFNRSLDRGINWSSRQVLGPGTNCANSIDMILDSAGNIYVVWDDYGTNPEPYSLIYFCRSEH